MTKVAVNLFRENCIRHGYIAKVVLVIHDEVVVECPKHIKEEVAKLLQFCMEEAGRLTMPNDLVKIIANPVIASYWKH